MNSTPIIGYDHWYHRYHHADGGTSTAEEVHATGGPPPNIPNLTDPVIDARMTHIVDQVSGLMRELWVGDPRPDDPRDE